MTFTFIELCSGCGGLSSGLINAGFQPLALIERDKSAYETLKLNHKEANVILADITKVDYFAFGDVDLVCGGIPCQSFSIAGKREGIHSENGQLVHTFAECVRKINPKMFLIENVKGLVNINKGDTLHYILSLFPSYSIKYKVLNAVNFGVPQKRERLFIVGSRLNGEYAFPPPADEILNLSSVLTGRPADDLCASYSAEKQRLFAQIPPGGCWVDLPLAEQKTYLKKSYGSGGGKRGILRRLSFDEPCLTILCSPSQKQTERCHPAEVRPLSVRESARIQTFPDDYVFVGTMNSQYKQIGNAVPVKLAEAVGRSIIKYLQRCSHL